MKAGWLHLLVACSHQQQGLLEAAMQTVTQAVLTFHRPHSLTHLKLYVHKVTKQALSVVMSGCLNHAAQELNAVSLFNRGKFYHPRETGSSGQAPSPVNFHNLHVYEHVSTSVLYEPRFELLGHALRTHLELHALVQYWTSTGLVRM